jgi:hypothetical protein
MLFSTTRALNGPTTASEPRWTDARTRCASSFRFPRLRRENADPRTHRITRSQEQERYQVCWFGNGPAVMAFLGCSRLSPFSAGM